MGKYFGTDGIRGIYGEGITPELAYKAGAALGAFFGGFCILARDTRTSGPELSAAVADGLRSAGCGVTDAGIIPTPAAAILTKIHRASFGVMVSASHNPPEYNGIKVFGPGGIKLNERLEQEVEVLIDKPAPAAIKGKYEKLEHAAEQYSAVLCHDSHRLDGVRVCLDCGNGASGGIAAEVFRKLGAQVSAINCSGDGEKINKDCGALYVETLAARIMKQESLPFSTLFDMGFALDGDADRIGSLYEGRVLDGDSALYSLSRERKLKDGAVVGTVMSNLALERRLNAEDKKLIRTAVGDKYILDEMVKNGYTLGGEQSGHYIFYPDSVAGDGLYAALRLAAAYLDGSIERLELVPQKTVSVMASAQTLEDAGLKKLIEAYKQRLLTLVVRMSGTEPKLRIMAEDDNGGLVDEALREIGGLVKELQK